MQQFEQAEKLLLESYSIISGDSGVGTPVYTSDALTRLVGLYEAWGRPEEVTRYVALLDQHRKGSQ